jgi:hypothetical protein
LSLNLSKTDLNLCTTDKNWNIICKDEKFWLERFYKEYNVDTIAKLYREIYLEKNKFVITASFIYPKDDYSWILDHYIGTIKFMEQALIKYYTTILSKFYMTHNVSQKYKNLINKILDLIN